MTAQQRMAVVFISSSVLVASIGYGYRELVYRRPIATDEPYKLWIAALKGFEGTVKYVGDADGYSYFVTGSDYTPRYKRPIGETNLPNHFPLGTNPGYRVSHEMVPQYTPPADNDSPDLSNATSDG